MLECCDAEIGLTITINVVLISIPLTILAYQGFSPMSPPLEWRLDNTRFGGQDIAHVVYSSHWGPFTRSKIKAWYPEDTGML